MAKGYLLSDEDRRLISALLASERRRSTTTTGRGRIDPDEHQAPEVYVAMTPAGGIPGRDSAGTGTGTGTDVDAMVGDVPGMAECDIYRAIPGDAGPEMVRAGGSKWVHNLAYTAIAGNRWITVVRDKYGTWYATNSVGGGSVCCTDPATRPDVQVFCVDGDLWTVEEDGTITVDVGCCGAGTGTGTGTGIGDPDYGCGWTYLWIYTGTPVVDGNSLSCIDTYDWCLSSSDGPPEFNLDCPAEYAVEWWYFVESTTGVEIYIGHCGPIYVLVAVDAGEVVEVLYISTEGVICEEIVTALNTQAVIDFFVRWGIPDHLRDITNTEPWTITIDPGETCDPYRCWRNTTTWTRSCAQANPGGSFPVGGEYASSACNNNCDDNIYCWYVTASPLTVYCSDNDESATATQKTGPYTTLANCQAGCSAPYFCWTPLSGTAPMYCANTDESGSASQTAGPYMTFAECDDLCSTEIYCWSPIADPGAVFCSANDESATATQQGGPYATSTLCNNACDPVWKCWAPTADPTAVFCSIDDESATSTEQSGPYADEASCTPACVAGWYCWANSVTGEQACSNTNPNSGGGSDWSVSSGPYADAVECAGSCALYWCYEESVFPGIGCGDTPTSGPTLRCGTWEDVVGCYLCGSGGGTQTYCERDIISGPYISSECNLECL